MSIPQDKFVLSPKQEAAIKRLTRLTFWAIVFSYPDGRNVVKARCGSKKQLKERLKGFVTTKAFVYTVRVKAKGIVE